MSGFLAPSFPPTNPVLSHFSLAGKTAAVTGGARGIGLEVVRGLAEAGAHVAILYTSPSSEALASSAAASIAAATGSVLRVYRCDVTDRQATMDTLAQVRSDFGKLDIVVANAGVAVHVHSLDMSEADYRKVMAPNLDGAFFTAQAAGQIFRAQGFGNLIFTASVSASLVNIPQLQAVYNASKAAVVHLAKSLAVEWVEFNARVNCVSPGYIATDMIGELPQEWRDKWMDLIPAKRFCEPAELKSTYVFLASDACRYMTGADIIIDGGYVLR